jgi:hypothetical protein
VPSEGQALRHIGRILSSNGVPVTPSPRARNPGPQLSPYPLRMGVCDTLEA